MQCKKGHAVIITPDSPPLSSLTCPQCGEEIHPVTKNDLDFEPSDEFVRAFMHSGSIVIDCELCGRTHFGTRSPGFFDEGELDRLMKKAEADPIQYVADNTADSISWGTINGKQAVAGCPCNVLTNYERFIWNHRFAIASFLSAKSSKRFDDAKRDCVAAESVKKSVQGT
jgi:hypothetical protein